MENRIQGIITIATATLIYSLAFKKYKNKQYNYSLGFIMLGGLILRIYTSMDFFLHEWDERYHALVAKNLLSNPFQPMLYTDPLLDYDYKDWSKNHIWLHKQPFPIYSIAVSMLLFGKNVIALRLPSILLSTLSIFATFKIGKILSSAKIGIIAAFLYSINGLIIEQTSGRVTTDHVDVFFYSLLTLSVYFLLRSVEKKSNVSFILGGIFTGFAILTKWLPALIVIPIWSIYSYNNISTKELIIKIFLLFGVLLAVVCPWQLYIMNNFPIEASWEYAYNRQHIFDAVETHTGPFYYHFDKMRTIFGELIYLPLIWLLISTYKELKKREFRKFVVTLWILIPYLFFSIVATKMQGYILFCAAPIFIMTAMFFEHLQSTKTKFSQIKNLILFLLIALPIRYSIERIKPFAIRERNPVWISEMKNLALQNQSKKTVIFNCKFPIETMFHTSLLAYENTPPINKLNEIKSKGYKIYIDNNNELVKELMNLDFVNYVEITGE